MFTLLDMYNYRFPRDKKWVVMGIDTNDEFRCLGIFDTQKEARNYFKHTPFKAKRDKGMEKFLKEKMKGEA